MTTISIIQQRKPLLGILRGAWVLVALLSITVFVTGEIGLYQGVRAPCSAVDYLQREGFCANKAAALDLGLSLPFMAAYFTIGTSLALSLWIALALLVFIRKSDQLIGIYISATLLTGSIFLIIDAIPTWAAFSFPVLSLPVNVLDLLANLLAPLLFFIIPDGKIYPRWGRYAAAVWMVSIAGELLLPGTILDVGILPEPFPVIFRIATIASGLIAMGLRWRNADPVPRQQMKWFMAGMILLALSFIFREYFLRAPSPRALVIHQLTFELLYFGISFVAALGLAVSILGYRLWEIDFVINRSLVYGATTVMLAAIFVGGFFGIRAISELIIGGDQNVIAAVLPAVFVTLIFNPTRKRLRDFIDRRFYGIQIDYATPAPRDAGMGSITHIGGYTELRHIGSGGMGEVYRGTHPESGLPIAIKILPKRLAEERAFRSRFEREGQVVTGLKHPNIVKMFDVGYENDTYYMAMEFVGGVDLSRMLRQQGKLSLDKVQSILKEICSALDYAHDQGIVHRDIKPSNVMMEPVRGADDEYRVVLMDFGIAKITTDATRLTLSGMLGTLDYIAPEQIQGAANVDRRADIYSLGVMTYQILTGELPFKKNNPGALVLAHLLEPPPNACEIVPELPHQVCAALQQAMAKQPEDRFVSAGSFVEALM